jgi:membrane protease YdiL (CAAX protease family)
VLGALALVAGVVSGTLVGGDVGATVGVILAMLGFQILTRGVEGAPYIVAALATTAGLLLIARHHELSLAELGLGRSSWITGAIWAAGIVVVVGAVIGLAGRWPRTRHLFADDRITDVSGWVTARRALLDIPFGTVLVEEFAFRGVLLALMTQLYSTLTAVIVTSVLFGLWHIGPSLEMHESHKATSGSPWPTIASTVLFTGLSGAGFAALRLYTGSLLPPAALHWAANGTGVVVGWIVHRVRHDAPEPG